MKLPEGRWEAFDDEEHITYEWAIGSAGELYIVARDPQPEERTDGSYLLYGGRYVEVVFSQVGWAKVEGTDCTVDAKQLRTVTL